MKGIILAGGSGTRLKPLTDVICKQLLPVYNKPMIFYPLSTLLLAGIDDVLVICNPSDLENFKNLLGDGTNFSIKISYEIQLKPEGIAQSILIAETFLEGEPFCLILGDNLIYGQGFGRNLKNYTSNQGATIFAYKVSNPKDFGIVEFDQEGKPLRIVEKPTSTESSWAVPGLYFYDDSAINRAKKLTPSNRGELEITDLNHLYLDDGKLTVLRMPLGTAWLDLGTPKSLLDAGLFIQLLEERQGLRIGDPYEISREFPIRKS
jgi:glucose-1-phosphate thymidylyltransferase